MAYDKGLAQRVREILEEEPGFDEKKMFGGLCFLLFGNMVCGIILEDLIVRVGADKYEEMLKMPHTRKFDLTGVIRGTQHLIILQHHERDDGNGYSIDTQFPFTYVLAVKKQSLINRFLNLEGTPGRNANGTKRG